MDFILRAFPTRAIRLSSLGVALFESSEREISKLSKPVSGVVAACSPYNRKIVGSNPGSALLIPEVNVVDIRLRALLGLCSLLVHSAKCAGNRM